MNFLRSVLVAMPMALLLGFSVATPAFASTDTIDVMNTGQILADGAAVTTEVTVTCSPQFPGDSVYVRLVLTQSVKKDQITTADSGLVFAEPVPCDDQPHTLTITVVPSPFAFQKGPAFAQATAGGMGTRFSTNEVIDLVK